MKGPSLLIVEDQQFQSEALAKRARNAGFGTIKCADTVGQAKEEWEANAGFDAVILDLRLENDVETDGYTLLRWLREHSASPKRVFIRSAYLRSTLPLESVALQRFTFYHKDDDRCEQRLDGDLTECVNEYILKWDKGIYYESASDKDLQSQIPFIASSELAVLIIGPTGSGKSVLAQQLAEASRCAPVVRINCAAISPHLFESELFGHRKGSFTGALVDKVGKLMEGSGYASLTANRKAAFRNGQAFVSPQNNPGAVILDEVATLSIENQAKLLTVLDGDPIFPVGHTGDGYLPNFRTFAVTNEEEKLIDASRFRQDLKERLQGCVIRLAPAHMRPDTARAVIKNAQVFFRDEQGERIPSELKLSGQAEDYLLICLTRVKGGFRELNNVIIRAHLYAKMERTSDVTPEHVQRALDQSFQAVTQPTAPNQVNQEEPNQKARDNVVSKLTAFFGRFDVEFQAQAKVPLDWAASLPSRQACDSFLDLASSFTNKEGRSVGFLTHFQDAMQPGGGTLNANQIRNQFQLSREKKRLERRRELGL